MKEEFVGYVRPSPEEIAGYWDRAVFAVDTNVLLNLYRYSDEARKELLAALKALGDRLWIPHDVAEEYHRARYRVLLERYTAKDALGSLLATEEGRLLEVLEKHERTHTRRAGKTDLELAPIAKEAFDGLRKRLLDKEDVTRAQLGGSDPLDDDPVYSELTSLISERIGDAFPAERMDEILTLGDERYKSLTPPGYGDADKDGPARYGDLVIWMQLIEMAKTSSRPVVFVTGDVKEDWFWRESGRTIGPRPELVREMRKEASVAFYAYPAARFLELARTHLGLEEEVTDQAIDEVRETSPGKPNPEGALLPDSAGAERYAYLSDYARARHERQLRLDAHAFVGETQVLLDLSIAGKLDTASVRCRVVRPDHAAKFAHRQILGSAGRTALAFLYPSDFDSTSAFAPGAYDVLWTVSVESDEGLTETLVSDRFVIPA